VQSLAVLVELPLVTGSVTNCRMSRTNELTTTATIESHARADTGARTPQQRRAPLALLCSLICACGPVYGAAKVSASDKPDIENRLIGHPKQRFPLTIYAPTAPSKPLYSAIQEAVAQWNQVFEQIFHEPAFKWTNQRTDADILIQFTNTEHFHHEMGETEVDADKRGVIRLPVKIDLNPPKPRGQTDVRQMLFDVTAHELGHALGLPHINKVNSIMCCEPGAIDFSDPATLSAYIEARRHPDLRSIAPDLAAHYRKFWKENGSNRAPN
jgi:hypothetical protein